MNQKWHKRGILQNKKISGHLKVNKKVGAVNVVQNEVVQRPLDQFFNLRVEKHDCVHHHHQNGRQEEVTSHCGHAQTSSSEKSNTTVYSFSQKRLQSGFQYHQRSFGLNFKSKINFLSTQSSLTKPNLSELNLPYYTQPNSTKPYQP